MLHCGNIRELARQMLMMRVTRGFSMPYRDRCPGHNWLAGFLKRHPGNATFYRIFLQRCRIAGNAERCISHTNSTVCLSIT